MVRDKSHLDQIKRWANFIRENPGEWKKKHKDFIDAQIIIARRFYKKLAETEEGRKKIILLRNKS